MPDTLSSLDITSQKQRNKIFIITRGLGTYQELIIKQIYDPIMFLNPFLLNCPNSSLSKWRYDTQHNGTQHNDAQQMDTAYEQSDTQNNDIQTDDTQQSNKFG